MQNTTLEPMILITMFYHVIAVVVSFAYKMYKIRIFHKICFLENGPDYA